MKIIAVLLLPWRWLLSHEAGLFEVISGFSTLGWGVLSMQTFSEGDQPASSTVFMVNGMQYPAAAVAIIMGLGQAFLFGLIDRNWPRHWLRFAAALFAGWLWANLFFSSVWNSENTIPPTVLLLFFASLGNFNLLSRILGTTHHAGR